jgi:ABC-type phosphate/phosphonate transport system substrate-binding protein
MRRSRSNCAAHASGSTARIRSRAGSCLGTRCASSASTPTGYVWVRTGSHHNSLRRLLRGEVDAAPIDSTVLTLEVRAEPALAALRTLARLGRMPSPPVALVGGDARLAALLRSALTALGDSDEGRAALALGAIQRFATVEDADYAPVRAADAADAAR